MIPWPELDRMMAGFLVRLAERARVLDAGCGPGRDTLLLRGRGARAVGLDRSFGALRSQSLSRAVQADLRALPLRDGAFDGVWCHAALPHALGPDVSRVLGEFARVTRPAGALHLGVSEGDPPGHRLGPLRVLLAEAGWTVVDVDRLHLGENWMYLLAHRA